MQKERASRTALAPGGDGLFIAMSVPPNSIGGAAVAVGLVDAPRGFAAARRQSSLPGSVPEQ
jgi:hypothetical protein